MCVIFPIYSRAANIQSTYLQATTAHVVVSIALSAAVVQSGLWPPSLRPCPLPHLVFSCELGFLLLGPYQVDLLVAIDEALRLVEESLPRGRADTDVLAAVVQRQPVRGQSEGDPLGAEPLLHGGVCMTRQRSFQPQGPRSTMRRVLSPRRYSSRPPALSTVRSTRAVRRVRTMTPSDSLHSRRNSTLGRHLRRVLISLRSDTLLPNRMRADPYSPMLLCLYSRRGPSG